MKYFSMILLWISTSLFSITFATESSQNSYQPTLTKSQIQQIDTLLQELMPEMYESLRYGGNCPTPNLCHCIHTTQGQQIIGKQNYYFQANRLCRGFEAKP